MLEYRPEISVGSGVLLRRGYGPERSSLGRRQQGRGGPSEPFRGVAGSAFCHHVTSEMPLV